MPKTLDDKVVSIEFDNKKFEKNAKQTMSTIDKLKAKLRFNKENRMSDDINKEIENVDLSPMETALRKFDLKCSAFEIARITGIQRIVNAAITAGANITRQLTTVPVSTGFAEYEEKMSSVQTIMAGTGESLENVMDALEKLNVYADKTIYSFSDMTSNIGKFTNAGVKLQDAVDAIRGVSNVAAVSGANTNEASRAMYNLAQSLSAGYVKLIDWKSIENANMATVEFKENLLDTAAAQGSLKKVSKGVYKTLKGNTVTATRNFNETLQEQWLTTDALIKTLRDYADETTEIGKKAYAAAQDVKTLSMLFDTLKEAVQSGWGTTWELIIGDFEEAKSFFTTVSDAFSGVIGKLADARNYLLMGGLSKQSNNWKKITNAVNNAGISTDNFNAALVETGRLYVANLDEIISKSGSFEASLSEGWLNSSIITKTFEKFNKSVTENLGKYTEEQQKIIQELYSQSKEKGSIINNLISNMDVYGKSSGRELLLSGVINMFTAAARFVRSVAAGINAAFGKVNSKNIYELAQRFNAFTQSLILSDGAFDKIARTVRGAANALKFVGNIVKTSLTYALKIVCSLLGVAGDSLLDLTANLGDWITKTIGSIKANEALKELLSTIGTIIQVIVALLSALFGAIRKNQKVTKGFNKILTFFSNLLKDVVEFLVVGVAAIADWINEVKKLDGFTFDNIIKAFELLNEKVFSYLFGLDGAFGRTKGTIDKIKEALNGIWSGFIEDFKAKYTAVYDVLKQIYDWISSFITKKKNNLINLFSNGVTPTSIATILATIIGVGIAKGLNKIGAALGMVAGLATSATDTLGEVGLAIRRLSKGLTRYFDASSFTKIAIGIAIMTASLIALAFVPYDKLKAAVPVLAELSAIFLGLNFAMMIMNKIGGSSSAPGGLISTLLAVTLFVSNLATVTDKLTELSNNFDLWMAPIQEAETLGDMMMALGKQTVKIMAACTMLLGAVALFAVFMKAISYAGTLSIKGGIALGIMLGVLYLFTKGFVPLLKEALQVMTDAFSSFVETFKNGKKHVGILGLTIIVEAIMFAIIIAIGSVIAITALVKQFSMACVPLLKSITSLVSSVVLIYLEALLIKWLSSKVGSLVPEIASCLVILVLIAQIFAKYAKQVAGLEELPKIGRSMLAISAALVILTAAVGLLTMIAKNDAGALAIAAAAMLGIMGMLTLFVDVVSDKDFSSIASSILKIAIGVALIIGSLVALSFFINDENAEVVRDIAGLIIVLTAVMAAVVFSVRMYNDEAKKLKEESKKSVTVSKTFSKSNTKKFEGVWQSIVAFGSVIAEIAGILYLFTTKIDWHKDAGGFWQAVGGIFAIILAVGTVFWAITRMGNSSKKTGKSAEQSITYTGKTMSIVIAAMAGLAYLVSMVLPIANLPLDKIIAAGSVIAGISLSVGAMFLMLSQIGASGKKARNISGTMLAGLIVSLTALMALVTLMILLANEHQERIIAAGVVVGAVAVTLGLLIKSISNLPKGGATFTQNKLNAIALLLGGFTLIVGALALLAMNDATSILASSRFVISVLAEISAIYFVLGKLTQKGSNINPKSFSEIAASFVIMSAAIAVISASLAAASALGGNNLEQAGNSIVTIVGVLALIMMVYSQMTFDKTSILSSSSGFVIMAAGVLIIAGALAMLSSINQSSKLTSVAVSLAIVIGAVALCISLFSILEKGQLLLGAVAFDIMAIGIVLVAHALEKLGEIDVGKLLAASAAISGLVIVIAALSIALGTLEVGTGGIGALAFGAGIASLYGIAGAILVIATAIEKVANSYEKLQNATSILPVLVKAFRAELSELIGNVSKKAETAYENGKAIIEGFTDGIKTGIIESMPSVYETITNAFTGVSEMVSAEIDKILAKISEKYSSFEMTGAYIMAGMRQGLSDMEQPVYDNMGRIGDNAIKTLNETCEIRSPSKRTIETGEYLGEGLSKGIDNSQSDVYLSGVESGLAALLGYSDVAVLAPEVGKKTFDVAGPNAKSGFGVLTDALTKKTTSGFSGWNLKSVIAETVSNMGLDKLFSGASSSNTVDPRVEYSKRYYSSEEDTQTRWDELASGFSTIVKNFKSVVANWQMGPNEYIDDEKLLEKLKQAYNEYVSAGGDLVKQTLVNQYLSDLGLSKSSIKTIKEFWKLTGFAIPYELIESLDTIDSSGEKLANELIGDEFDIKKYFEDLLKKKNQDNENSQAILDSVNATKNILGSGTGSEKSYTFVQNNYSPKALSSVEIYRQTNNQLSRLARKGW